MFGRYPPVQPGWYPDPSRPAAVTGNTVPVRYFDGAVWTPHAVHR